MKNIQNLIIDINKKPFQTITANVGEVASRFIRITILDNNIPIDLAGVTVYLYAKKADGTKVFNSAKVEDAEQGIVLAELTSQVLAVPGFVRLTLLLIKDGAKLASKQIIVTVDESNVDEEALESSNEFKALDLALGRVDEWNGYFEETSGKIEEKYTERLNQVDSQLEQKVSYPILQGEVGVLNVLFPYGNIKRYGAVDDYDNVNKVGTDNTEYIQNAITSSLNIKCDVLFPAGRFLVCGTLYIPPFISMKGIKTTLYPYSHTNNNINSTIIYTKSQYVFKPENDSVICCDIKDIIFVNHNSANYRNILFKNINFRTSTIEIGASDYHIIFYGALTTITYVQNSYFMGIYESLIYSHNEDEQEDEVYNGTVGIIDSFILNNYINGKRVANPVSNCFNISTLAHSSISNNFIDYFKKCFGITKQVKTGSINNNVFDVIFKVFGDKSCCNLTISDNSFNNITYDPKTWTGLEDNDMLNSDWCIFYPLKTYYTFNNLNICNNKLYYVDRFMVVNDNIYNVYNLNIQGNNSKVCKVEGIDYCVNKSSNKLDQKNIYIDDMMYKIYADLPNPKLTGSNIRTFNKQIIIYKNKFIYNNEGVWFDMLGNEFIDS